eukprot:3915984-Amphidinium_carterae.1
MALSPKSLKQQMMANMSMVRALNKNMMVMMCMMNTMMPTIAHKRKQCALVLNCLKGRFVKSCWAFCQDPQADDFVFDAYHGMICAPSGAQLRLPQI